MVLIGKAEGTSARRAGHFLTPAERIRPKEFGPQATFRLSAVVVTLRPL